MTTELLEFASLVAEQASPGPSGRRFHVIPWGADTRNPDALIVLASATGNTLATEVVKAIEWRVNGAQARVSLVMTRFAKLVGKAIEPAMNRPIRSVLPKNGLWRGSAAVH